MTASRPLRPVLIAAVLLVGFGLVAAAVLGNATASFDRGIMLSFRDPANPARLIGPVWLTETLRDLTALGSSLVLWLLAVLVSLFLVLARRWTDLLLLAVAVAGGQAASTLLKLAFGRLRPDLVPGAPQVFTSSFPSGHALVSAAVYLSLGALLARGEPRPVVRYFYLGTAAALTLAIGLSRIALGVHWPTDVLGGWCFGAAWVILCFTVARRRDARVTGRRT